MPLHWLRKCRETDNGDGTVTLTGPYFDRPGERSVTVKVSALAAVAEGAYIQDAMSDVSLDDREFLMSGMSPEGWDDLADDEDDEPDPEVEDQRRQDEADDGVSYPDGWSSVDT